MENNYDFSQSVPNPYLQKLNGQEAVTISAETISYFKARAAETGRSYQALINELLRDYIVKGKSICP